MTIEVYEAGVLPTEDNDNDNRNKKQNHTLSRSSGKPQETNTAGALQGKIIARISVWN